MRTRTHAAFWSRHGHGGHTGANSAPNRSAIASAYRAPDLAKELAHDTDLSETTATSPALAAIVRS